MPDLAELSGVTILYSYEKYGWSINISNSLRTLIVAFPSGSTEELLSDAEYVALVLGLFLIIVLAYLITDGCRKG